jgi:hypothetical protein
MKIKKILLITLASLVLVFGLFLFLNRDKFTYVGQIEMVEVDCNKKGEILDSVYRSDQRIRTTNVSFEQLGKEDHRNQELVISIIEKCGMPSLKEVNENQMRAVFLALQHTDKKHRKKYFPLIEEAVKKGDLSKQEFALMKDRILVEEGKPQLYGSQFTTNGKLHELEDPDNVNERRKEMGMGPLEEYLKRNNIEFPTKN